ncbi:MAG: glycosyltransferase family 39 protein [Rhizomicrobium sp.]
MSETAVADAPRGRFAGILGWLSRRPLLALALLCLTLWTPGVLSLPPLDRDESRFAQSSKQMLESGDLIDIRFGAVPRYKKPVGIYWMQAAATEAAGLGDHSHIWTYRLPSLLGAMAAVWLAFWCARAFATAEVALLAAALLGSTVLLAAEATIATTDAVLLACILGAQGMLFRVYLSQSEGQQASLRLALAGWVAFGLAVLVKGPLVFAVCGLTIVGVSLWDRDWRWLRQTRPLLGVAVVLAIVAPWAIAIALRSHGHFYEQSLGQDFANKLQGGQESHGAPPGYYLALVSLTFWPAILFLLPSLAGAIRARTEPAMRFLLVWVGAYWLMVECVPTKLPHYILPVYPALAMLGAVWALGQSEAPSRWWEQLLRYVGALQFAVGAGLLTAGPIILPRLYGGGAVWWPIASAAGAVIALIALIAFLRRANLAAAMLAFVSVLAFYPLLTAFVGPGLEQLWVSPRAAAAERVLSRPGDPPPALAGYVEPSLVFLLGTETRQTDGHGAADAGAAQGGLALVEDSERSAFMAHLAELETDASEVGAVSGYNYSRGRPVHIHIYRVTPLHETTLPPPE